MEANHPKNSSTRLGATLALCSVPSVMSAIVLVPILPELFRTFGNVADANFWIPALITIPGLCVALLSPVAGYLGDRFGMKTPIVVSLVLFALFGALPLLLSDFTLILASRVALGVSQVCALVLSIALIGQQFEGAERERWLAIQTVAATSSSLILLPLSGLLAGTSLGWNGSFLLFLSGLVLAVVIARLPVHERKPVHGASDGPAIGLPWRWLLARCFVTLLVGILFFTTQFQFGLALSTVGIKDSASIGLLSALAAAGIMIGSLLFVQAKRLLGGFLLPMELLLCGTTLLLMHQFPNPVPLVGFAFGNMVACGMMLPTLVTAIAAGLPDAVRGRGLGMWNSSFTFAQFASAGFVGIVLARPGATILDAFAVLGIASLIMAATGIAIAFGKRNAPGEHAHTTAH